VCLDDLAHLVMGELPGDRIATVDAHCAACPSCRAERELLARSAALVAADAPKLAPLLALSDARQQALREAAAAGVASATGGSQLTVGRADASSILNSTGTPAAIRPFWTVRRLAGAAAAIVAVTAGGQWLWRSYDLGGRGKPRELQPWHVAQGERGRKTRNLDLEPSVGASLPAAEPAEVGAGGAAFVSGPDALNSNAPGHELTHREQPHDALVDRLSAATDARDTVAARAAIDAIARQKVELDPAQIASLSVDLAQAEQPELALELLRLAPRADTLDDSTRDQLKRVGRFVEGTLPEASKKDVREQLDALGYLASEDAEETLTEEHLVTLRELGYTVPSDDVAAAGASALRPVTLALDNFTVDSLAETPALNVPLSVLDSMSGTVSITGTPELSAGFATSVVGYSTPVVLESTTLSMAVNGADFAYPGTTYDFPDVATSTALSLAKSNNDTLVMKRIGDTAVWIASDTDGANEPARGAVADPRMQQLALAAFLANVSIVAPSDLVAFEGALGRTAASGGTVDVDAIVKSFLAKLAPQQGEAPRDMFFRWFGDHAVVPTRVDCRSTFGMDVDSASYNLARAYLAKGTLPPKAAIRTEEFVNAFKQGLAAPAADSSAAADRGADAIATGSSADVFALTTELAPSPFGAGKHLLRVGLKAREIDRAARKPAALTFVIDVSGSMNEGGRLELVKQSLRLLVAQLDERDSVGIVVFSENARIALAPTRGSDRERILAALDPLRPEQSTNAGAGLRLGYDLAIAALSPDADNRVVLCSDGVANAGITDPDQMTARIRECKGKRIGLTTVGVGMNNLNDALLEQLAREGDGNCHYVDGIQEAKELFVDKLTGTLTTVARDAKIQVEFEPGAVVAFRQLGYENRALNHQDFRNDRVDAGEVGAGHEVVALYELDLAPDAAGPLATVRCRYEDPRTASVREQARICFAAEAARSAGEMGPRFRLAAAVAEFAELLRQSVHARDGSLAGVLRLAEPLVAELPEDKDVPEFVALVQQAARLPDLLPPRTAIVRCVDELKRTRCLEQELRRLDPPQQAANDSLLRQLEQQNQDLERALRAALTQAATPPTGSRK
jgi:Ca-activated chloride channel family protein